MSGSIISNRSALACCLLAISLVAAAQEPLRNGAGPTTAVPDPAMRAQELLSRARAAIGSSEAWSQLQSLVLDARIRRHVRYLSVQGPDKIEAKEKILNGKMRIEALLPDRFWRRVSNSTLNGYGYSYTQTVNGERAWRNPAPLLSSHRDNRIYDVGDLERSAEIHAHDARRQLAPYTLGWLLQPPPAFPTEFIHAGLSEMDGRKYETIVIRGPNSFHPALLLDAETLLPFAIVIYFLEARREMVVVEVASVSRQYIQETYARARREREARRRAPERHELQLRFSDHQEVNGLKLPHRITTLLDGELIEELIIPEFRFNRDIDPKKFEGQSEIRFE